MTGTLCSQAMRSELPRLVSRLMDLEKTTPSEALEHLAYMYSGDSDLLSSLLHQLDYSLQSLTQRERIHYSTNLFSLKGMSVLTPDAAGLIKIFLADRKLDPATCSITHDDGMSLLHGIAGNINLAVDRELHQDLLTAKYWIPLNPNVQQMEELLLMARGLIAACPTRLHGLALRYDSHDFCPAYFSDSIIPVLRTPLMMVISGYFQAYSFTRSSFKAYENWQSLVDQATLSAMVWLEQLGNAGVDLLEYGRKEKEIQNQKKASKEWAVRRGIDPPLFFRLISFTYGPEPTDWKFWFTDVMEIYFIQFWNMVDHPERAIPGAWVEDQYVDRQYPDWAKECCIHDAEIEEEVTQEDCDVYLG
jgi:hypothetical protein